MPKIPALWANNITKSKTAFTAALKQNSSWALTHQNTSGVYLYNDPSMRYDDTPLRGYDYLVPSTTPTTNTINNKLPAAWAQVV